MTQTVTIQGELYEIPAPYTVGHVLTEIEAAVLNQTFAENVRNNVAGKMRQRAAKNEPALTAQEVEDYARSYSFEARASRGPRAEPVDPVEREARSLAKAVIMEALKKKGRTFKSINADKDARQEWLENMIDQLLGADPSIRESAAKLVESRKSTLANVGPINV